MTTTHTLDRCLSKCIPDSGGPLTCDGKLVGLASFGIRCGLALDYPGVFTDVHYFSEWIKDNWNAGAKLHRSTFLSILGFILRTLHNYAYR